MSDVERVPLRALARLTCDICGATWHSAPYRNYGYRDQEEQARPALEAGWRVFAGKRARRTYCPSHGPTTPMHLVLGPNGVESYQNEPTQ